MSISIFIRRLHLSLGVALLPWFVMYAIGALVLNHRELFVSHETPGKPGYTVRLEREYHRPVPKDVDLRPTGEAIARDFDLGGRPFWVYWTGNNQLLVHPFTFLSATDIVYDVNQGHAEVRDLPFRWDHFFVGMHERAGFGQSPQLTKLWAIVVDLVGVSMVAWVISGIYVWWTSRQQRGVGAVVLVAGAVSFTVLVLLL